MSSSLQISANDELDDDVPCVEEPASPPRKHSRRRSREYLDPAPQSKSRQSTLNGAIFNLSATILGGGILSMPFCMELCGLAFGVVFMLLLAVASDFSVYILVSCSRRVRHGASYEEVVESTFGKASGRFVVLAMFVLVYLCVVAYALLIRDLVPPLLELAFNTTYNTLEKFFIVACCMLLVFPLCMKKNIHDLGWTSIVSISAMIILAYCVIHRGIGELVLSYNEPNHSRFHDGGLKMLPTKLNDVLYALPIFACGYACHFNVLPLHRELIRPTRPRIKSMINWVISLCSVLYMSVGIFGYLFARKHTDGNILNNFHRSDPLAVVARVALACCIITGLPMIVMPTRQLIGKMVTMIVPSESKNGSDSISHSMATTPQPKSDRNTPATSTTNSAFTAKQNFLSAPSDPHAEQLRSNTLTSSSRSYLDYIDARDPIEPEVDSDNEVDELFNSRTPPLDINDTNTEYFSHDASSSVLQSPPLDTEESAKRSFDELTPLMINGPPSATVGGASDGTTSIGTGSYTNPSSSFPRNYSSHALPSSRSAASSEWIPITDSSTEHPFSDRALMIQTIVICVSALLFSVRIHSVATLWNLVGSSVCILTGYIIPSACYLSIRRDKPLGVRMLSAWLLLIFGVITLIVCGSVSLTSLSTLTPSPKADRGTAPDAPQA